MTVARNVVKYKVLHVEFAIILAKDNVSGNCRGLHLGTFWVCVNILGEEESKRTYRP